MLQGTVKVSSYFFAKNPEFWNQLSMWRWHLLQSLNLKNIQQMSWLTLQIILMPVISSFFKSRMIGHFDQWLTSTRKIQNWNVTKSFYYDAVERNFLHGVTNRIWILLWAHVWWWRKIFYVYSIYVMYMYNYIYMFSRWLATIRLHQKVKINFIDVPVYRNGRKCFFKTFREFEFKSGSSWTSYLKYSGAA